MRPASSSASVKSCVAKSTVLFGSRRPNAALRWLVEEHNLRVGKQRPRYRQTVPHARGVILEHFVRIFLQPHEVDHVVNPFLNTGPVSVDASQPALFSRERADARIACHL